MIYNEFVYKIQRTPPSEPADFSIKKFSCYDFLESTRRFIETNFTGAITVSFPGECYGYVCIAPRGFAYFIRLLLAEIYGNSLARATIEYGEGVINVKISSDSHLCNTERLLDVAKRSGFECCFYEGELILSAPVDDSANLSLLAFNSLSFINYYLEVFLL
jgi:hypothetical protein